MTTVFVSPARRPLYERIAGLYTLSGGPYCRAPQGCRVSRTRRPTSRPALLAGDPRGGSGGLPSLVRVTGPRYDTILGNRRVALFGNMGPDKRSEGVISPSSLNPGGPPSGFHASGASTPRREVFALRKLPGTGAAPIGRREAVIARRRRSDPGRFPVRLFGQFHFPNPKGDTSLGDVSRVVSTASRLVSAVGI